MKKPNTPNTAKPATASIGNDTPLTAPVSHIKQFNPSRDLVERVTLDAVKANKDKLLKVLSAGGRISCLNCSDYGFAPHTAIHSLVSELERVDGIPVMRNRSKGLPSKEYWFSDTTLKALNDPDPAQIENIKLAHKFHMERRRIGKQYKATVGFFQLIESSPGILARIPELQQMLMYVAQYGGVMASVYGSNSMGV